MTHPRPRAPRVPVLVALVLIGASLLGILASATPGQARTAAPDDADEVTTRVDVLPLAGPIDPTVAAGITDVLETAAAQGVDVVVLQIDTVGGLGVDAEALLRTVRESPVPVAVYAGPGLVEADMGGLGVLLLLEAAVAAVAPDATIGPALPVDLAGDLEAGRGALEAAVSARFPTPPEGLLDTLARRALTAEEAFDLGVVDLVADGIETLLVDLDGVAVTTPGGDTTLEFGDADGVGVRFTTIGLLRRILHASSTPTLLYLTLLVGVSLLLFELFQPGFGVAGFAAMVLIPIAVYALVVLPVAWWAAALLVLGLVLLAADVALAGLGPPTALGTLALVAGSVWLFPSPFLGVAGWIIAFMVASALVFFVIIMTIVLRAQAGPDREVVAALVGKLGVVRSVLNPEGHVYIDEALWRSRRNSGEDKVAVGTTVEVVGVDGAVLLVDAVERPAPAVTAPTEA